MLEAFKKWNMIESRFDTSKLELQSLISRESHRLKQWKHQYLLKKEYDRSMMLLNSSIALVERLEEIEHLVDTAEWEKAIDNIAQFRLLLREYPSANSEDRLVFQEIIDRLENSLKDKALGVFETWLSSLSTVKGLSLGDFDESFYETFHNIVNLSIIRPVLFIFEYVKWHDLAQSLYTNYRRIYLYDILEQVCNTISNSSDKPTLALSRTKEFLEIILDFFSIECVVYKESLDFIEGDISPNSWRFIEELWEFTISSLLQAFTNISIPVEEFIVSMLSIWREFDRQSQVREKYSYNLYP